MKKAFVVALFCYSVIALSGCSGLLLKDQSTINPALLEPQAAVKFSDVPVPMGFKLVPQESYSFEASGMRVGMLKYQGKIKDADQVVNFYKEQMAMYNWNLLNIVEYGQRLLNFDRENETCIISLLPKGRVLEVTIAVGPKAQQQISKREKPVK